MTLQIRPQEGRDASADAARAADIAAGLTGVASATARDRDASDEPAAAEPTDTCAQRDWRAFWLWACSP